MNERNLIRPEDLTPEERRESASKAGKASGVARRKKRDMKAKMKMLLELPCQNCDDFNSVTELGIDMEDVDNETVMLVGLFNKAKTGDVQAIREIRNIIGKDISTAELELKKKELKIKEKSKDTSSEVLDKLDEVLGGIKSGF